MDTSVVVEKKQKMKHGRKELIRETDTIQIQPEQEDPCTKGNLCAQSDYKNADYRIVYSDNAPYCKEYIDILYEDYHVRVIEDKKADDNFCNCYNDAMIQLLNTHFGFSVFARVSDKISQEQDRLRIQQNDTIPDKE